MKKKEFTAIALDLEYKFFIVYLASFNYTSLDVDVYQFYRFYIAGLIAKETSIKIPIKYAKIADVFFLDLVF